MGGRSSQPIPVILGVWTPAYVRREPELRSGRCLLDEKILDPGFTCFPIHSHPVVNQISAAVDEHRWEHVGVNIILVVKVQFVVFVFVILLVVLWFAVGVLFILLADRSRFNRAFNRRRWCSPFRCS
jgi:hypothetical protein